MTLCNLWAFFKPLVLLLIIVSAELLSSGLHLVILIIILLLIACVIIQVDLIVFFLTFMVFKGFCVMRCHIILHIFLLILIVLVLRLIGRLIAINNTQYIHILISDVFHKVIIFFRYRYIYHGVCAHLMILIIYTLYLCSQVLSSQMLKCSLVFETRVQFFR